MSNIGQVHPTSDLPAMTAERPFRMFSDDELDEFAAMFDLCAAEGSWYGELAERLGVEFRVRLRELPSGLGYWLRSE